MYSFLILSNLVTPKENLNIFSSATSSSDSCLFLSDTVSKPYSMAGLTTILYTFPLILAVKKNYISTVSTATPTTTTTTTTTKSVRDPPTPPLVLFVLGTLLFLALVLLLVLFYQNRVLRRVVSRTRRKTEPEAVYEEINHRYMARRITSFTQRGDPGRVDPPEDYDDAITAGPIPDNVDEDEAENYDDAITADQMSVILTEDVYENYYDAVTTETNPNIITDLEKAYDRVPREELWYCVRKSGVAEKYVRVVQDMYERSRTVMRCAVVPAALEQLCGAHIFSKLGLHSPYNLIHIRRGDKWKMEFITPSGHYEYLVMPYGLSNTPSVFQSFMNEMFWDMLHRFVVVYIDDIFIYSPNLSDHVDHVKQVLNRLRHYHLYLKLEKCEFHQSTTQFLGYVISPEGIQMDCAKVKAIKSWPQPSTMKDVFCNVF
ncbi:hypothetical protein QTP86_013136 [Hemibagrus guttatus]|nr:hypothetical protein QTP86_013136 [Hemibagrus guttatus]